MTGKNRGKERNTEREGKIYVLCRVYPRMKREKGRKKEGIKREREIKEEEKKKRKKSV